MKTTINKVKTLFLAGLLSLGFLTATAAAGTPKGETTASTVRQKITRAVSLPEELKNPGFAQKVKVAFELDTKGNVQAVVANTPNAVLKQNLESQFKKIALPELKAGAYNVEINFNVY